MPTVSASARSLSRPLGLRPWSPYRRSPSHVPCKSRRPGSRRLYAGHRLARNTGTRQAHLEGTKIRTPDFGAISEPFDASTAHAPPGLLPGRALLERLPGPHLTRSSHAFSLTANHDGLQPTQRQGGFSACPRRADAGGPTIPHLSHSSAYVGVFYTTPPSAFVTHISRLNSWPACTPRPTLRCALTGRQRMDGAVVTG